MCICLPMMCLLDWKLTIKELDFCFAICLLHSGSAYSHTMTALNPPYQWKDPHLAGSMQTSAYCPFSLDCADLHLHYKGTNCKGLQSGIRAATHPDFQCAQRSVISALGNQDHSHVFLSLSLLPCMHAHPHLSLFPSLRSNYPPVLVQSCQW